MFKSLRASGFEDNGDNSIEGCSVRGRRVHELGNVINVYIYIYTYAEASALVNISENMGQQLSGEGPACGMYSASLTLRYSSE